MNFATQHLASITPFVRPEGRRVLTLPMGLAGNLLLILTSIAMSFATLIPIILTFAIAPRFAWLSLLLALGGLITAQFWWMRKFPDWPFNLVLHSKLRRVCRSRRDAADWMEDARMVEWVPRNHLNATRLDTAEDIMLIHVDESGVHLEGDRARYWFPAASIIDVETESVRPQACLHPTHFVQLTVRTANGPEEFLLAYRDHRLGGLGSGIRRMERDELRAAIAKVAVGGDLTYYDPQHTPFSDSTTHRLTQSAKTPAGIFADQPNPYAAPRT